MTPVVSHLVVVSLLGINSERGHRLGDGLGGTAGGRGGADGKGLPRGGGGGGSDASAGQGHVDVVLLLLLLLLLLLVVVVVKNCGVGGRGVVHLQQMRLVKIVYTTGKSTK